MFATELRRLIHERIRELGPCVEFHVLVVILGLYGPLLPSRHGCRLAAGSPPFDPFGELDAMDILKVEFHLRDGWKSLHTFWFRMWVLRDSGDSLPSKYNFKGAVLCV